MPSVVVNVVKYERANYSSLGDLLTTITTSHQHIIMMEIVIPQELQHYPVTSNSRRGLFSDDNDSTSLKNQYNKRKTSEMKKKGESDRERYGERMRGGLEQ